MMFWSAHFRYHRRYGLEDWFSRLVTMAILVLFFVYPLKYLIYGVGFAGVWGLYALLYVHALRKRGELALTANELVQTRASLAENVIYVVVCALSITLAYTTSVGGLPGFIYMLLGPAQAFNGWWFGRKVRATA